MRFSGVSQSPDQWVETHLGQLPRRFHRSCFTTISIGGTDVPLIVIWTAVAALFFTVYLRFINVARWAWRSATPRGIFPTRRPG